MANTKGRKIYGSKFKAKVDLLHIMFGYNLMKTLNVSPQTNQENFYRTKNMFCHKCGTENNDRYEFCTGCGANLRALPPDPRRFSPPANTSPDKNVERLSQPTVFSSPVSGSQALPPPVDSMSETIAVPTFASNLSYRVPKGNSNKLQIGRAHV